MRYCNMRGDVMVATNSTRWNPDYLIIGHGINVAFQPPGGCLRTRSAIASLRARV
jgi:hypothetical protein